MKVERRRALLLAALALSACGLAFQEPTVRVAEARVASLGLQGGMLVVAVQVENPNRYALEGEDLSYRLSFRDEAGEDPDWVTLAEGGIAQPTRIEPGGSGLMAVEVPFGFASLTAALGRLLWHGELEYRFTGALTVGTPVGKMRVPFDERGVLHR
jgi:LEA14-like dessication related protein